MNWKSVALLACSLAPLSALAQDAQSLAREAKRAYDRKQYAECSRLYSAAIDKGSQSAWHRYDGACCHARAGSKDEAFALIDQAIAAGFKDADHFAADSDFAALHADPRWASRVEKVQRAQAAHRATLNTELATMKEEDQAVRREKPLNFEKITAGDAIRYRRVREMIAADQLRVAEDYFNAALIMQHGSTVEDYELARRLATRAAELDPDLPSARWLACAAQDRALWAQGKPQIYGTQFKRFTENGPYTMEPWDRDAVSDAQRQAAGVRTLAESEQRLEEMNKNQ